MSIFGCFLFGCGKKREKKGVRSSPAIQKETEPCNSFEENRNTSSATKNEKNSGAGYRSDTLEPDPTPESQGPFAGDNRRIDFPSESLSSKTRVNEWIKDLEFPDEQSPIPADDYAALSPETVKSSRPSNSVVPFHCSSSTAAAAHISAIPHVIPNVQGFSGLRRIDFSDNSIVHITPGSLPKGLRVLNLSRNKIVAISGLRELSRLRVLDLSRNRISRIGHGLSNCTMIRELYLRGNKISNVEGLHRLLKLAVLDLSFNKINRRAVGQLAANCNSLLALNLLGNPVQNSSSQVHLKKMMCGLLPRLAYLNKQLVRPQRSGDAVSRAAICDGASRTSRRKKTTKVRPTDGSRSRAAAPFL